MSFRELCLNALHRLYRSDQWLQDLYRVAGLTMSEVEAKLDEVHRASFFDVMSVAACRRYERELGIAADEADDLDNRRAAVRAKWIADGKVTLEQLREVANSWRYGAIDVGFEGGRIQVKFVSPLGVPAGLDDLKAALDVVKPAHLAIAYSFMWLTWGDCLARGTWRDALDAGVWENTKRLPTH